MKLTRSVKILLVLVIGFWGAVGTLGKLMSIGEIYPEVEHVTSMAGVPDGVGPPWRTANPVVVWGGVLTILLGKVAALCGGLGGFVMLTRLDA